MWTLVAVLVAVGIALVVVHPWRHPATDTIGGVLQVEFTVSDPGVQESTARRCGLGGGRRVSATAISYRAEPSRERPIGDCLLRSGNVRAVGLPQ